jgi:superfamily II DNA or RNA helicase
MDGINVVDGPTAKRPRRQGIFKKDVWTDLNLGVLRIHAAGVSARSVLSTAYFVPAKLIAGLGLRKPLEAALTARPKSKKFQGKETRVPWPMWHEREEWLALPRPFGLRVFGRPATVQVSPGAAAGLGPPARPLFTAETCQASRGIDQEAAVTSVVTGLRRRAADDGCAGALFCLSPGFGKTCCAAHFIQRLGRRALFVVPNEKPFARQVADEMRRFLGPGTEVGLLVTSNKRRWKLDPAQQVVITTFKSAATIDYDLGSFGTVIVDEAHETATACLSQMYFRFPATYTVALTATPERAADHCGGYLRFLVGEVAWHEMRDVAASRWSGVDVTVYTVRYRRPIEEPTLKDGEVYWEGITRQLVARRSRLAFLVDTVIRDRLAAGRRVLAIGTRVQYMEEVQAALLGRGVDCGIIVGEHTDGRKVSAEQRLEAQQKPCLVASTAIVSKALNIPALDTLVVLNNAYVNDTFWKQAVGRITRDHPTKQPPELVLVRDCVETSKVGGDGVFAKCVDAACATLTRQSPKGYRFRREQVVLA